MTNKCATMYVICDACMDAWNVGYDRDIIGNYNIHTSQKDN